MCTEAETGVCAADPCCLCDAEQSVLACGSTVGADGEMSCELHVCVDAQYCSMGQRGRLGGAMAVRHGLLRLHPKA